MKIFIVLVLIGIIGSLGSGLYYLLKDRDRSPRTVRALTLRISLSIALFLALLIAFATGLIKPHSLRSGFGADSAKASSPADP